MAVCLNTKSALILYEELVNSPYFVDKSAMIENLNKRIRTSMKYVCVTKPRRFGKTSVLNMLGAYYCKAYDTEALFDGLDISRSETYAVHLNQYNVINLCLNRPPDQCSAYEAYINLFINAIKRDILEAYPALADKEFDSIADLLTATEDRFI